MKFSTINTDQLCAYGCGKIALFMSLRGKMCCSETYAACEAVKQKKLISLKKIGPDGTSSLERRNIAISKSKFHIGEDGLTVGQRIGNLNRINEARKIKISNTMKKIISSDEARRRSLNGVKKRSLDIINGEDGNKRLANKSVFTRRNTIMPDGKNLLEHASKKAMDTMKNTIMADGRTKMEHRSDNIATALYTIGENGLTKSDVGRLRCLKMKFFEGTNIAYQGKLELRFIKEMISNHGFDWVSEHLKRGPVLLYSDPITKKTRRYQSDFVYLNTLIEVKSKYWWERFKNENKAKLQSALDSGFEVWLYLDGVFISGKDSIRLL